MTETSGLTCKKCDEPLLGEVRGRRCEPCRAVNRSRLKVVGIAAGIGAAVAVVGAIIVAVGKRDGGWLDNDGYDPSEVLEAGTEVRIDATNYNHLAVHPPHLKWATIIEVMSPDFDPWYYVRAADGEVYGAQRDYIVRARAGR